jgi:hypothetical protein
LADEKLSKEISNLASKAEMAGAAAQGGASLAEATPHFEEAAHETTQALNREIKIKKYAEIESQFEKPSLVNMKFHNAITMLKKSDFLEVRRTDTARLITDLAYVPTESELRD